jgi:hypothetical protein
MIFVALLAIVIVAFVFTIGNTPGCVGRSTSIDYYGHTLSRGSKDVKQLSNNAIMSSYLHYGRAPFSEQYLQIEIYRRAAYLHLANELKIPAPSKTAIQDMIKNLPAMQNQDGGGFSASAFTRIVDLIESDTSLNTSDIESVLSEDFRMEQVLQLLGDDAFVLKDEAKWDAIRANTKYDLEVFQFAKSAFNPTIEVKDEDLENYYKENKSQFRVLERIKLTYVTIPSARFTIDAAILTDEQMTTHFNRNSFRYVDANAEKKPETYQELDAEKLSSLKKNLIMELQQDKASKFANDFAYNLFDGEIEQGSPAFKAYLEKHQLTETEIEPYSQETVPTNTLVPQQQLRNAFSLTEKKYFSDAFRMGSGFAVLFYKGKLDPYIPEFSEIKDKVEVAYRQSKQEAQFVEKGNELLKTLQDFASTDGEKDFEKFAKDNQLTFSKVEAATFAKIPETVPSNVFNAATKANTDEFTKFVLSKDSGYIARVVSSQRPEGEELDKFVTERFDQLKSTYNYLISQSMFSELLDAGFEDK